MEKGKLMKVLNSYSSVTQKRNFKEAEKKDSIVPDKIYFILKDKSLKVLPIAQMEKYFNTNKDNIHYLTSDKNEANNMLEKFKESRIPKSIRNKFFKEAEGSGDGLLSDDIIEDLRTCNMSLQMVCVALKDNATEQTLIDTFHLSPAETKIVANALKFIKKEITLVDVNSTPNTEVMKVSGTVYITVPDATGLKLLFSDNQNLLKRLVSLQGFLNTPQRTTTSIVAPMFMEKRNFRKRNFREGSSGSSPFSGMNKSGTPKFTIKDWKKLKQLKDEKKDKLFDSLFIKFFPNASNDLKSSSKEELINWSRPLVED